MRWEIWIEAKVILSSFHEPLADVQGLPDDISRLWMSQGDCSGKWYVIVSHRSEDGHLCCLPSCFTKVYCGLCFLFERLEIGYCKETNC